MGDAARTESGLPVQPVYDAAVLAGFDPVALLGEPGATGSKPASTAAS